MKAFKKRKKFRQHHPDNLLFTPFRKRHFYFAKRLKRKASRLFTRRDYDFRLKEQLMQKRILEKKHSF